LYKHIYSTIFIIIWLNVPALAYATCYDFEQNGESNTKAIVCLGDDCFTVELAGYCGGNKSYGASFLFPGKKNVTYSCEARTSVNNNYDFECIWNVNGDTMKPIESLNSSITSCTPSKDEVRGKESDPCEWLLK